MNLKLGVAPGSDELKLPLCFFSSKSLGGTTIIVTLFPPKVGVGTPLTMGLQSILYFLFLFSLHEGYVGSCWEVTKKI